MVGSQAPPDFLGDGCEDDLDAVAGAAEASLMAEGCYVPASSLEEEPFGYFLTIVSALLPPRYR
jgi:hypothetical protein